MEIHFTPEQEAQLAEAALFSGKTAEQLVQDLTLRFLHEQEAEFLAVVDEGIADADAGRFVDHEEVWGVARKALRP